MKVSVKFVLTLILVSSLITGSPALSNENPRLKSMITELEGKIEDADRRMVAHPSFLNELRALAQKYKSLLKEVYFSDTFNDGNYTADPRWMVKSGAFEVTSQGYLTSSVFGPFGAGNNSAKERSLEQEAVGILLDSIFSNSKSQNQAGPKTSESKADPAVIFTKKRFPPAFELKMRFKSSQGARMDILLLGTSKLSPWYRLKFFSEHSDTDPIELVREGSSRSFVVGASTRFPVVNDGQFHTLTWVRLPSGQMDVYLDGKQVLQTYEAYYREDFTGLALINNSGSFQWDEIEIYKPAAPGSQ